jgi:hypothetical protein
VPVGVHVRMHRRGGYEEHLQSVER